MRKLPKKRGIASLLRAQERPSTKTAVVEKRFVNFGIRIGWPLLR